MPAPIYLDNAATTPVRPEVREAIAPFLGDTGFGNPSSAHSFGRTARAAVEDARQQVATALAATPEQVVFTSGGTEADNLAVLGGALAARSRGAPFHVAVSAIEHKAVIDAAKEVQAMGGRSTMLPVDENGVIEADSVQRALAADATVVSAMWVNNETGVMQDVTGLAPLCTNAGALFHTDAVQAVGKVPCTLDMVPGACMSISGHKIGALKGSGALIVPDDELVHPLLHGGGQQRSVRPGTENVIGIVALGKAVELAVQELESTANHVAALRSQLERGLQEALPHAEVIGVAGPRAPHIAYISFAGVESTTLLMHLDLAGICCSSGSACNTGVVTASHVTNAMGVPNYAAISAVRISFSKYNTKEEVNRVIELLPPLVEKLTQA
ncbi:MAG: cysteine desulfurase [Gemmatimonadota bacterium]|nr:MAG: cysteine desulfurase [Gemmatimonadota bacterium]